MRGQGRIIALVVALAVMVMAGSTLAQQVPVDDFNEPGAYVLGFAVEGRDRRLNLYVPEGYDPDVPAPLVLALHGAGGTGSSMASISGFNDMADEEGFIVAYPDGFRGAWNDARPDARTIVIDDVTYLDAVIDFLTERLSIDTRRIYAAGYSMGGMMSFRLGCQLPDKIAAVASVASTFPAYQLDSCLFAEPVSVLVIQGTEDEVIPYQGYRDPYGNRMMMSVGETMRYWSETNGCDPTFTMRTLPDTDPDDETRIRVQTFSGCENDAEVQLYLVRGGAHTWPGHPFEAPFELGVTSLDIDATRVIWNFFEQHELATNTDES